nr:hypothetical protein [Tanacetum cinerariifolium]
MIMPSKDNLYNAFKSYFEKAKDLRPTLYDEKINFEDDYFQEIINPDFQKIDYSFQQTSSLKPYVLNVILENIIIDLEDEVVSLLEKEKENLEIIESLKSKGIELSETVTSESENQSENDCLVVEKECDKKENSKVIAPEMFKLNMSQLSRFVFGSLIRDVQSIRRIMKSLTTNIETSINEEVFHEVFDSFQGESSSSSMNDDVQQSPEEVILPQTNTQSIPINMVPNGDEASTSRNVFNERLEDAYFDAIPTPMVDKAKLKLDLVGKPVDHTDYQSMIGSLMYVTSSRPDIMFATCMCARYQANPNEHYMSAVKRIFRYLKGTINLGFWYLKDSGFDLTGYSDADNSGCHLDRKTESEYVMVSSCCAQVLWMRTQLTDYGFFYDKVPIYCDSKSAIAISYNPVQHTRTKHIDV